jgi:MFS family permease
VVLAPAIGPTVGGWITDNIGWRWVFLINVPVGVVVSLLAFSVLTDPPAEAAARRTRCSRRSTSTCRRSISAASRRRRWRPGASCSRRLLAAAPHPAQREGEGYIKGG